MRKKFMNRCIISNKLIDGREVILKDYALEYVEKQGYQVNKIFEDKRK